MRFSAFPIIVLFALTNASVASGAEGGPKSVGVGVRDNMGTAIGLEFVPPDEPEWITERSGLSVTLRKNSESGSDNRQIEAYLMRLEKQISSNADYMATLKGNLVEEYAKSKQYKIGSLELSEDQADNRCIRGHLLLEAVQPNPETQEKKWSEQYFLSCRLVKNKGLGFELRYYHRYLDSKKDAQFAEDARRVLDSAKIEDK